MQHTLESPDSIRRLANGTIDYDWYIARADALRHEALHGQRPVAYAATGRGSAMPVFGGHGAAHGV